MEPPDRAIARVAGGQFGVFSRAQALEHGHTRSSIQRRLDTDRWERVHHGVYRIGGAPSSWAADALAATLAAGDEGVLSHPAAARLWEAPGFDRADVEISVPPHRRPRTFGVVVHRTWLDRWDRTVRDGIPVTSPARTLLDLAPTAGPEQLEEVLDDFLRRGLTTVRRLRRFLDSSARRGRAGIAVARSVLDERDPTAAPPESVFETRLLRLVRDAGLPRPVTQVRVRTGGRIVARLDLAYPDSMIAIEADGYRHHAGRAAFERDRARHNVLTALGWTVLRVTWRQMHEQPGSVVAHIATLLTARAAASSEAGRATDDGSVSRGARARANA